jgi:hypothetical protein
MSRVVCAVALACACGKGDEQPPAPVDHAAEVEPRPPALVAPHSGGIQLVALIDTGDAALTVDDFDQLRLWPSLDGNREPIVVRAAAPKQIALGRDGDSGPVSSTTITR